MDKCTTVPYRRVGLFVHVSAIQFLYYRSMRTTFIWVTSERTRIKKSKYTVQLWEGINWYNAPSLGEIRCVPLSLLTSWHVYVSYWHKGGMPFLTTSHSEYRHVECQSVRLPIVSTAKCPSNLLYRDDERYPPRFYIFNFHSYRMLQILSRVYWHYDD